MTSSQLRPILEVYSPKMVVATMTLRLKVELQEEPETGRWIADVTDLPGVLVYGATKAEAMAKAKLLALDVVGDRLSHDEDPLTGCDLKDGCPPFGAAARFEGVEFYGAVAC